MDPDPSPLSDYAKEDTFHDASELMAFLGGEQFRRGGWIFRGQSNATWKLQPSLERFATVGDKADATERYIYDEFQ